MSLLRDIQHDLAIPGSEVSCVLLKCKILAARLGSGELADWVSWELNGYSPTQPIPEYRRVAIEYFACFLNLAYRQDRAPIPLQIVPEEYRLSFHELEFRDGIAKADSLAKTKGTITIQRPELVPVINGRMYPAMDCHGVWGEIPRVEFKQLISAVKAQILDFALKLEEKSPAAGEAPPDTVPLPKEELRSLVQYYFYAPVGAIAQDSHHVSQNVTMGISDPDLKKLVTELSSRLGELRLNERQQARAEAQLAIMRTELAGEPDHELISQAGRTLRNITEGAIAGLMATAAQPTVWHWVHQALNSFPR